MKKHWYRNQTVRRASRAVKWTLLLYSGHIYYTRGNLRNILKIKNKKITVGKNFFGSKTQKRIKNR